MLRLDRDKAQSKVDSCECGGKMDSWKRQDSAMREGEVQTLPIEAAMGRCSGSPEHRGVQSESENMVGGC